MAGAIALYQIEQAFESHELIVTGDWAFERGIERVTAPSRTAGPCQPRTQRALLILRRAGDARWRYARHDERPPECPRTPSAMTDSIL
jgi:ketosteroid isomerase-like protein